MRGISFRVPSIAALVLVGFCTPVFADGPDVSMPPPGGAAGGPSDQNQEATAVSGPRQADPYYLPKGIPLSGPFRLFPNLFTSLSYDDNVYRQKGSTKVSSAFLTATPTLILDYDIERLKLDLYGQGSYLEYRQYTLSTYNAGLRGRYEISHDATFEGNVSDGLFYEAYSSPNTIVASKRPNEYQLIDASGKFNYQPNRIGVTVGGSYDAYAFTATPPNLGLANKNFERNATVSKGWLQGSYDFSPGYSAFIRGTYNSDDYSHLDTFSVTPVNRSSHGYNIDAGVTLLLGDLIQGQVYVGYLDQIYKKNQAIPLKDVTGIDFGADLNWYPTELLTVHLAGSRQIENTTVAGSSAGDDRGVSLGLDYELLRTLHLLANAGYDDTRFGGIRDDKLISFGGGGKWLMSHYVWLVANYTYTNRSSTDPNGRYVDNLFTVGLNLQD
jgi:hypothetical protein